MHGASLSRYRRAYNPVVPVWARLIAAMAGLRGAIAVVLYLSGTHTRVDAPPLPWITDVALAICFGVTGVALAVVNKHDARASWLGGTFWYLPQRRSRARFSAHTRIPLLAMLWFVRVEAFQPAFLWRFASEFPSPLVGRPAVMFRAIGRVALAAGTFIALVNLSFILWPDAGDRSMADAC